MKHRQPIILLISVTLVLHAATFGQETTRRIFTLYGDLKMVEFEGDAPENTLFDLILYTRTNEAFARQRAGKGGRYRFTNVPEGNYNIGVELHNIEVARVVILISHKKNEPIRQDMQIHWSKEWQNIRGVTSPLASYIRPNQNRPLYDRALKEINKNELAKATATLRSIVETDPKDFLAWSELGMVYFIQKNFAAAETSYAKAIELRPDYVSALVSLARMRLSQKNYEGAIAALEPALKAEPKSAIVNFFLGEAYLGLKKGSIAITHLNEAIKLDPVAMATAHLRLATLYHLGGYKDRAAIEYNEFLKKKPDYPEAQRMRDYIIANGPRSRRNREPDPNPSPNP